MSVKPSLLLLQTPAYGFSGSIPFEFMKRNSLYEIYAFSYFFSERHYSFFSEEIWKNEKRWWEIILKSMVSFWFSNNRLR